MPRNVAARHLPVVNGAQRCGSKNERYFSQRLIHPLYDDKSDINRSRAVYPSTSVQSSAPDIPRELICTRVTRLDVSERTDEAGHLLKPRHIRSNLCHERRSRVSNEICDPSLIVNRPLTTRWIFLSAFFPFLASDLSRLRLPLSVVLLQDTPGLASASELRFESKMNCRGSRLYETVSSTIVYSHSAESLLRETRCIDEEKYVGGEINASGCLCTTLSSDRSCGSKFASCCAPLSPPPVSDFCYTIYAKYVDEDTPRSTRSSFHEACASYTIPR